MNGFNVMAVQCRAVCYDMHCVCFFNQVAHVKNVILMFPVI